MNRKIGLAILLIVFNTVFTALMVDAGTRRGAGVQQGVATIVAFVSDYMRPLPRLDRLP